MFSLAILKNPCEIYHFVIRGYFLILPAFAECPVQKDGDECEKGIRQSSRLPKNFSAWTKHFDEGRFGEQISEGGYASAGFAEAVKIHHAEARGASLLFRNQTSLK
jgi:hypothetical protein